VTDLAFEKVARTFVLTPRLVRLVRTLRSETCDKPAVTKDAVSLAQHLVVDNALGASFFNEASTFGELSLQPTDLASLDATLLPVSFHFGSVRLLVLLVGYWTSRLFLLGLVDSLLLVAPSASGAIDASAVHDEEAAMARSALMTVQHTVHAAAGAANRAVHRSDEMRLVMLLQAAYGAWGRVWKRLAGGKETGLGLGERAEQARTMQRMCFELANGLLEASRLDPIPEVGFEFLVELFAGGPLLQDVVFGE
jgi:hypothetical protein